MEQHLTPDINDEDDIVLEREVADFMVDMQTDTMQNVDGEERDVGRTDEEKKQEVDAINIKRAMVAAFYQENVD